MALVVSWPHRGYSDTSANDEGNAGVLAWSAGIEDQILLWGYARRPWPSLRCSSGTWCSSSARSLQSLIDEALVTAAAHAGAVSPPVHPSALRLAVASGNTDLVRTFVLQLGYAATPDLLLALRTCAAHAARAAATAAAGGHNAEGLVGRLCVALMLVHKGYLSDWFAATQLRGRGTGAAGVRRLGAGVCRWSRRPSRRRNVAPVSPPKRKGFTALHCAVQLAHIGAVVGPSPATVWAARLSTPRQCGCSSWRRSTGIRAVVETLLEHGARPRRLPTDICVINDHPVSPAAYHPPPLMLLTSLSPLPERLQQRPP
ncbi:hypothetical protein HK405_013701 [Cladochytrium tenue]|nr:hypothetical protein HK405_013701 [Cladochytrium tenue]